MEGASLAQFHRHTNDGIRAIVKPTHQLTGRDAQHRDALLAQPRISPLVFGGPVGCVVRLTIDLDREARYGTVKIDYVRTNWMLATKHGQVRIAFAEMLPKPRFRRG